MSITEKLNKEYEGSIYKNTRGNYVHVKLNDTCVYGRRERQFDMCEASTIQGAIDKPTGRWAFTNSIKSMIKRGKLIPVS